MRAVEQSRCQARAQALRPPRVRAGLASATLPGLAAMVPDSPLVNWLNGQESAIPGELRVVAIEGQPLFGSSMAWQVHDAKDGLVAEGQTEVAAMHERQPWALRSAG